MTDWNADLAHREAEIIGDPVLHWCTEKPAIPTACGCAPDRCADGPAQMLGRAAAWLFRAEDAKSTMAFHALEQAARALDRAALGRMPLPLIARALALADRCRAACQTAGYPRLEGLWDAVAALADDEAASR